jgi:MFS superfamily sulfate permease-like transporter
VEDLVDVLPFAVLAVLIGAGATYLRRRRVTAPQLRKPAIRDRIRSLIIVIGVVVVAPTVGIGIGTALSLSQNADARLGILVEVAALSGAVLWRKLWLERQSR